MPKNSAHSFMSIIAVTAVLTSPFLAVAQEEPQDLPTTEATELTNEAIVLNFVNIGQATYADARESATTLRDDILTMIEDPTEDNLEEARISWQTARVVYKQSEIFRYASPFTAAMIARVDNWPIDEGFIDYVDESYEGTENNELANANIIASSGFTIFNQSVTWDQFTPTVLADQLNGAGGFAQNVAVGYQAIEFMLWGQDTDLAEAGEGSRAVADFDIQNCADDYCDRRGQFLVAAAELLINDLSDIATMWAPTGAARTALLEDPDQSLVTILSAMGAVARTELIEHNLQRGLLAGSAEMESDAFSDYSHASYLLTARGALNAYLGDYFGLDGTIIDGASVADLVASVDPELDRQFRITLSIAMARMRTLLRYARDEEPLDSIFVNKTDRGVTLIGELVEALNAEANALEKIAERLDVGPLDFSLPPFEVAMIESENDAD